MKIYTKVGDKGQTALLGGNKVSKSDARIEAYGTVDELNAVLGWVRAGKPDAALDDALETLQHWLFDLGGLLAAAPKDRERYKLAPITAEHVTWFEKKIDALTEKLPELKQFILPAGTELSARLHMARTVARRAERALVRYGEAGEELPENAVPFLNRVSDYLFVAARSANHLGKGKEVFWKKASPAD